MTPKRKKRLTLVLVLLVGLTGAAALALTALQENMLFFYEPSRIVAGEAPLGRSIRVGGMVVDDSVVREPGSLKVQFTLTDYAHEVPVHYEGLLPDLFREGQGIIARGTLSENGAFVAEEVLAKHDESYMPPEVAASLKAKPSDS